MHGTVKRDFGQAYKEDLTLAEIDSLLSKKELLDKSELSNYVPKAAADKYAAEAAEFKKKYNSKLSEDEQKEAQRKAEQEELAGKYEQLLKESTVSKHKAKFLGIGYDETLATETAEALVAGNMEKVFENQSKFNALREQAIKAEVLKTTPTPPAGNGTEGKSVTKADFAKMSYGEREKIFNKNKTLYEEIVGGNA